MEWKGPKEFFPNNSLIEKVGYSSIAINSLRGLSGVIFCKSLGANIPWIGCCHQLAVWLCSVCLIGSRQSRHRVDNHSDDRIDALLCEFPAIGHLKRVEDVHAECFNLCCADVLFL